jgi:hypothetical protein
VSNFISNALAAVFNALRLGGSGGGSVFTSIWNFVVGLAERAVLGIVRAFGQPVLDMIGRVAATVGIVASIVSAIRPWTVSVTAVPPQTVKGVGGSPGQPGQLVARVDLGGLDTWPPYVEDCARVAGAPLPNLKPEGAPVTWQPLAQAPSDLVVEGSREARLDAQGVARLDYTTLVDAIPAPWQDRAGSIRTGVTIERPALEQLRNIAIDQLLGALPGIIRGVLEPYLRPTLDELGRRLTSLIATQASGPGTVIFHVPAATPPPDTEPEPAAPARAVWVHLEREGVGDAVQAGRVLELVSCSGPYGAWSGVMRVGGLGPVPFSELPVGFSFRGAGGVQGTQTSTGGDIPWSLPGITSSVFYVLDIVVDGRTMTLTVTGRANEEVQGVDLLGDMSGTSGPQELPIEPAPPGSC